MRLTPADGTGGRKVVCTTTFAAVTIRKVERNEMRMVTEGILVFHNWHFAESFCTYGAGILSPPISNIDGEARSKFEFYASSTVSVRLL